MQDKLIDNQISVIMSCYREPLDWIQEAIDSILNQTYTYYEFLIINDNPKRKELKDFLLTISEKDYRIRIIENPHNLGLTKSLNIGLNEAKGEFIARMDADDISMPTRLEKQLQYMKHNQKCGIVGCWVEMFGKKKGIFKCKEGNNELKAIQFFQSPFDHPATFIRTSTLKENTIRYNETLRYAQDQELWAELAEVCEFHNIPEVLFKHRFNNQQVSLNHSSEQSDNVKKTRTILIKEYLTPKGLDYIIYEDLNVPKIKMFLKQAEKVILDNNDRNKIDKISMSLLMSLRKYSLKDYLSFLNSRIYLSKNWNLKEFIRLSLVFFTQKKNPYLGIIKLNK